MCGRRVAESVSVVLLFSIILTTSSATNLFVNIDFGAASNSGDRYHYADAKIRVITGNKDN